MQKLTPGQRVKVLLTAKHETASADDEDVVQHSATLVRMHRDGEWADVALDGEHAGGTKLLSVPLGQIVAAILLLFLLAVPARSQFVGFTSPQTVTQTALNAAGGATTFNVQNLGQNMHFLSYTRTGTVSLLDLRMEGSNDGVTFFPISDDAVDVTTTSGVLYAVGYYPVVRVNLVAIAGGGTITANYTGTSGSSSPPTGNSYTGSLQGKKVVFSNLPMNANQNTTLLTQNNNTAGFLFIVGTAAFPAGSSITISSQIGNAGLTAVLPSTSLTGVSQILLPVSSSPATAAAINYISGGASANLFTVYYIFTPPAPNNDPCASPASTKSSVQIAAGAAGTTKIITEVAAEITYVCGYQAAQAATAGTVQWTSGTGATCGTGTVTNSGPMPVTAGQPFTYGPGSTLFSTARGAAVCLTATGAGGTVNGLITFVQQ